VSSSAVSSSVAGLGGAVMGVTSCLISVVELSMRLEIPVGDLLSATDRLHLRARPA
jgi:hypothetical protein